MKRIGVFCDVPTCENPALGMCSICDKDICAGHGSKAGIRIDILRAVEATSSHVDMAGGAGVMCWRCLILLSGRPATWFKETILPELLASIVLSIKAAVAAEALK